MSEKIVQLNEEVIKGQIAKIATPAPSARDLSITLPAF